MHILSGFLVKGSDGNCERREKSKFKERYMLTVILICDNQSNCEGGSLEKGDKRHPDLVFVWSLVNYKLLILNCGGIGGVWWQWTICSLSAGVWARAGTSDD